MKKSLHNNVFDLPEMIKIMRQSQADGVFSEGK
jgi:hypothetical protein